MRLDIDDGYTLTDETKDTYSDAIGNTWENLPTVSFKYRPALPVALAEMRMKTRRANSGKDEVGAIAEFLSDHLSSWDVLVKGQPAELKPEVIANVPEPILNQILNTVAKWAPKAAEAKGN